MESVAPGTLSTKVHYTVEASDNSDDEVSTYIYPPSGSLFPVGITRVWGFARDTYYNTAYCFFDVVVSGKQLQ